MQKIEEIDREFEFLDRRRRVEKEIKFEGELAA
jgi:hypothetical protein